MHNKNSSNQNKKWYIKFIWNGIDIELHTNYAFYSVRIGAPNLS